ncbi:cation/H(+) antiporter 28-like [Rutidosis leptorrhynchoides]|uniref:cation/H(+) antiporter 28-like n=1 Tax=Rutidosis leptorrhynchoides TaxID=125765 RepID=UPI003A998312
MATNVTATNSTTRGLCSGKLSYVTAFAKVALLFLIFGISNLAYSLVKRIDQPRIVSDMFVGIFLGTIYSTQSFLPPAVIIILDNTIQFGMMCYMFVLGLEMDPHIVFKPPTCEAVMAYGGMLSTFIVACSITPFLGFLEKPNLKYMLFVCVAFSGCSSQVITRIITNLKMGKSDIGKLGIGAGVHCDMISIFIICIGYVAFYGETKGPTENIKESIKMGSALVIQTIIAAKVSPFLLNWINNENPEGKTIKGSYLVLALAFMVIICSCAPVYNYDPMFSSFMGGLFLPPGGRISKWTVSKLNYALSTMFYPAFFFWVGFHASIIRFEFLNWMTYVRFLLLIVMMIIVKVAGTVIAGLVMGFHWPESVALGALLTAKGHFHVYVTMIAAKALVISDTTCNSILFVIFLSIIHHPYVVANVIRRGGKSMPTHGRALQWLDPGHELRILHCLHGPDHVPATVNLVEVSRGPAEPGVLVYVTDMVELTDTIATTLVHSGGDNTVTVTDKAVTELRDQITAALNEYMQDNGQGISIKRMLALSTFNNMSQDISVMAEDLMVSLIILPFHKNRKENGALDEGHPGFRYVNRKVLRNAPCSVGLLVDRGFGTINNITRSAVCITVAIIFIGGKDDREALAYSSRVAWHPGVKLTVIRFLVDRNSENEARRANYRYTVAQLEEEMKRDDECFAHFYERHVAGGQVAYMEKHLANSSETFNTLRGLEGLYSLIIVGRGGRLNNTLTVGLNDWQRFPELGIIADVLCLDDFSVKNSVLVIQEHNTGEVVGLDEDFSTM